MEFSFLILLLIGLAAGVLAGLFGIGGGVLFTPILFLLFKEAGMSQLVLWTIGTSLFCTFIAAAGSSIRQYRQDNFFGNEGLRVGLLGAAGVWAGKQVATAAFYTEQVFAIFFSLLFLYVAYRFVKRGRNSAREARAPRCLITLKEAGITGGAGGFVAALAGIGGGSVMVPIMNLYYRIPIQKAVSVSSLAIVFISLSGWLQLAFYPAGGSSLSGYALGVVDLGAALPLSIGGLTGGFLGAFINLKVNRQYLQYGFALLALIIVVKLLSDVF
ncbi:sulfite exporter TauE/SafE family protein [Halalkalibaculum sp. DA3122]|uniref:sulfite exporter TauE/SafE family protein n=1 Tax=Halalkalibaculum sp. DA3122 TaxID=3373607 RepID=UPI003753FAAC